MKKIFEKKCQERQQDYLLYRKNMIEETKESLKEMYPFYDELYQKYSQITWACVRSMHLPEQEQKTLQQEKKKIKEKIIAVEKNFVEKNLLPCVLLGEEQAHLYAWKKIHPAFDESWNKRFSKHLLSTEFASKFQHVFQDPKNDLKNFDVFYPSEEGKQKKTVPALALGKTLATQFLNKFLYQKDLDSPLHHLYLWGDVGTGKTYLSKILAFAFLQEGKWVEFRECAACFSLFEELRILKQSFYSEDKEEKLNLLSDEIDDIFQADLLVLDDLGRESTEKRYTLEYLLDLLNFRIERQLPTVITSNLSLGELHENFDERLSSRMQAHFTSISFADLPDYRLYLKAQEVLRLEKRGKK